MSSLSQEQKNLCPLCRTEYAHSDEETVEQLCRWVGKGKAWAQSTLGQRYQDGIGVDQSDQQARELFELAAIQGYANACIWVADTMKVKVWIKVTREPENTTRQQQDRELGMRRPIWGLSFTTVKVSKDLLKRHASGI